MGGVSGRRWFIALAPAAPQQLLDHLGPAPPLPLRPLQAADLHVTLAFLGDCSTPAAEHAFAEAEAQPPAACRLRAIGTKRLGGRSAAAWALLLENDAGLTRWVATHRAALLDRAGQPAGTRRFLPHITLARGAVASADAVAAVQDWLSAAQGFALELNRLGLYHSASAGARRYATHCEHRLA